ncbi:MAG: glycosyltransferase family 2 protein [Treponema sp.]|jgi:dolichol-phosphate mannosyltransferase|nr:glycosyltransferase family 2 protein [Treponema sp.]
MEKISIIVPVYFSEANLEPLYADLQENFIGKIGIDYELVFVDDGSKDESWEILKGLAIRDRHIRLFRLSRNFGSHAAILCGLVNSNGDCAVVKAADMQEPTELILNMYTKWKDGNNVVLAVREGREDLALFSNLYYWLTRKVALPNMPRNGFDVFLLDRKVIEVLRDMDERNSALTGQILWSGFRTAVVPYIRRKREIGRSRWTLYKKIRLVTDTLFTFSTIPISFVSYLGFIALVVSFVWGVIVFIGRLRDKIPITGFTTLMIFNLSAFGIIMLTLGILGSYLWRTFSASLRRPTFIVEERI